MYNTDKPILNSSEDLLGRSYFAKQLGKAILTFDSKDNIVVGMYGKWGTGKTSIINMAVQEIDKETSELDDENKPIIFNFVPWNFTSNENLIIQFFRSLREKINKKENTELKLKIGVALEHYAEAIEFAEIIPNIIPLPLILKLIVSYIGKQTQKKNSAISIDSAKESLVKALKEQPKKIIIIIDDIDRLSNDQIRMIFQLVNQVASFPNTTYILSMDKEVVKRALESIQHCNGEEYLEKIIQIPFNIPEMDKSKLQDILLTKLSNIIDSEADVEFNIEHWTKVYMRCIEPYIHTIRDVNRVINVFKFKYDLISIEANFADLIGITTLEVLQPTLLRWIIEHKKLICGDSNTHTGVIMAEQDKKKKLYKDEFDDLGVDGDLAIDAIAALFPKFGKEINHSYEQVDVNEIRGQLRIAHTDRFDLYFKLDINEVKITRGVVNESVFNLSESNLEIQVNEINESGNIINFLQEIRGKISVIPYYRIAIFLRMLYRNMTKFEGEVETSFLSLSASQYAENCINLLMKRLNTTEERHAIYTDIIKYGDINILAGICVDINRIELGYGRLAGKKEESDLQLVSLNQLKEIETSFANRLKALAMEDSIFDAKSLMFIKYFWENFDPDECRKYFDKKLKDDVFKLKLICKIAGSWVGTEGKGWSFDKKNYENYVDGDEIYNLIQLRNKKTMKKEFTEEEILILASFSLNNNRNGLDHVSITEAKKLVELWEKEK